jgi:integrase
MSGVRFEVRVNGEKRQAVQIHRRRPLDTVGAGSYYAVFQGIKPKTKEWGKVVKPLGTDKDVAYARYLEIAERLRQGLDPEAPIPTEISRDLTNPVLAPVPWTKENQSGATWNSLYAEFQARLKFLVRGEMLAASSEKEYLGSLRQFDHYLKARGVAYVKGITREVVDEFCHYRIEQGAKRKWSSDARVLHILFEFAVDKKKILDANPVRVKELRARMPRPKSNSKPFTTEELNKIEAGLKEDEKLLFNVLYRTGLRKEDAADLRWSEVEKGNVTKTPKKTKRKTGVVVSIPIQAELQEALDAERERRKPKPAGDDYVLLNPNTKRPYSVSRLWNHLQTISTRVKVPNVSPHRFRGSFAHFCYLQGVNDITVAEWLGDKVETVRKHYTFFSKELGDQAKAKLLKRENGSANGGAA